MYDLEMDGIDAIEVVSELFGLKDFTVVFSNEEKQEYDRKKKIVYMQEVSIRFDAYMQLMGLAHEIMHHKQYIENRHIKGFDLIDYAINNRMIDEDENLLWIGRIEPTEIEANAFCALFINKVNELFYKNGMSKLQYNRLLKKTKDILAITKFFSCDKEKIAEIKSKEEAEYKRLEDEYGDKINELLGKRLSVCYGNRTQTIKIINK